MEGEGHVEGQPCDEPAKICGPRQMTLARDGCEQPHHQQRQCQRNHTQGDCAGLESNPLAEQNHASRQRESIVCQTAGTFFHGYDQQKQGNQQPERKRI